MIKISTPARLALAATLSVGLCVALAQPASADEAPGPNDVTGVGSDIVQNSMDFIADGYFDSTSNVTDPGYNTAGNKYRLVSFDATSDGNGRNAFSDPSLGTSSVLNPTVTLRAGTSPVQRPNGGGAGLTALINDGQNGKSANLINFVRSPNEPTAAQLSTAQANLGSTLHTVQFATDQQVIATGTSTNAPTLSAQDLVKIYEGTWTTWSQVPGGPAKGSAADQTIIPEIPQNGSGVQKIFLAALSQAAGSTVGVANLAADVKFVQQNDPTSITGLSAADQANAIVPFPVGRYTLLKDGYFHDPSTAYSVASPPKALTAAGITLQGTGTSTDGNPVFNATIPYYIIFRQSDLTDAAWQPGSTLNWAQTLFSDAGGPAPYLNTAPVKAILKAEGLTAAYNDLGVVSSG